MNDELVAAIDRILAEHKTIMREFQTVDRVANDSEALAKINKAKDAFMPGGLNGKNAITQLQQVFNELYQGLRAHFNFEETELLKALQKIGDPDLVKALHDLLLEHHDLRDRLAQAQQDIERLRSGGLDRQVWEASGYDMRAHLTHTHKLLQAHADLEQDLLLGLKKKFLGTE